MLIILGIDHNAQQFADRVNHPLPILAHLSLIEDPIRRVIQNLPRLIIPIENGAGFMAGKRHALPPRSAPQPPFSNKPWRRRKSRKISGGGREKIFGTGENVRTAIPRFALSTDTVGKATVSLGLITPTYPTNRVEQTDIEKFKNLFRTSVPSW
jgi:hypothetical protein